jgi:hypothetical protein
MKLFVLFFLTSFSVFAQSELEDLFENRILEGGFSITIPQFDYLKSLKGPYAPENAVGISGSYLINPLRKKEEISMVFIGAEMSYESVRQNTFNNATNLDGFYAKHISYAFRGKAKFVPILVPRKFLPSISVAIGPRVFSSKLMEQLDQDQVQKVDSYTKTVMSYAFEAGIEINRFKNKFVKISLVYDVSNSVKMWDRNLLSLSSDYKIISPVTVVSPQALVLKVALVNYR